MAVLWLIFRDIKQLLHFQHDKKYMYTVTFEARLGVSSRNRAVLVSSNCEIVASYFLESELM
jgi:hypothetical protein